MMKSEHVYFEYYETQKQAKQSIFKLVHFITVKDDIQRSTMFHQ